MGDAESNLVFQGFFVVYKGKISTEQFCKYSELNVYENKVMMALLKKRNYMGILIESIGLSNILRGLFELAWVQGRKDK